MSELKIKGWEHLTNGLITITILGGPITYLVQTEYAKRYRYWFKNVLIPVTKKAILKAEEVYNNLSPEQQTRLENIAIKGALKTKGEVEKLINKSIPLDEKSTKSLLKVGSKKILELAKK